MFGNESADVLYGGGGRDTLFGGTGDDWLHGGDDKDRLDGGEGADRMWGGQGNDTFVVDHLQDLVVELPGGGVDTVEFGGISPTAQYSVDFFPNIENARLLSSAGASNLSGNFASNILIGNEFSNTLNGGADFDWLEGGGGDDVYVLSDSDRTMDYVYESMGEGTDTVIAQLPYYQLGENVENLTMASAIAGSTAIGLGNELNNNMVVIGSGVQGYLYGLGGDDNLTGGAHSDSLEGGSGFDRLFGGDGADDLDGLDGEHDELYGGSGADTISGDHDLIVGGAGDDQIVAGSGSVVKWNAGDGLDRVVANGSGGTIKFDTENGLLYSVKASFVGNDLVLATNAGEGVVLENWKGSSNNFTIELPNGATWTTGELESQFSPAKYTANYNTGVYTEEAFAAMLLQTLPNIDNYQLPPASHSTYNPITLDTVNGFIQQSQSVEAGYDQAGIIQRASVQFLATASSVGPYNMPNYQSVRLVFLGNLTFDRWTTTEGESFFSVVDGSWTGGQFGMFLSTTPAYSGQQPIGSGLYHHDEVQWTQSWSLPHGVRELVVVEPAVTEVTLFDPVSANATVDLFSTEPSAFGYLVEPREVPAMTSERLILEAVWGSMEIAGGGAAVSESATLGMEAAVLPPASPKYEFTPQVASKEFLLFA